MSREFTATVSVVIGGMDRDVCVIFEVESYGYQGSYFDPPEPPSIVINDVRDEDECGRSLYDLCEQTRDIWAKPMYADGIWQVMGDGPRTSWDGLRTDPAWAQIGFNAPFGAFHSLLDTLYEAVLDRHMPDYEPSDDDIRGSVYYPDTRTEYDV